MHVPAHELGEIEHDASFIRLGKHSMVGAVARDHIGNVLTATWSPLPNYEDAVEAKIKAALMGIKC
jgi:hypothetical protein